MRWAAFSHDGKTYDLAHLHPKTVTFFQSARGTNPPRSYKVNLIYSLHCFTRGMEGKTPDPQLLYSDDRETRIFDFRRYELSNQLPAIIKGLMTCKCFHAERGNFFTIKIVDEEGKRVDYEIYFAVSKASKPGTINLFVQSAYTRDKGKRARQQKPIRFSVILFNTLNKVAIRQQ